MSFQLAYIEVNIDSDTYEVAETYLERGCIVNYSKTENNIWNGIINPGNKAYEVEIKIKSGIITNLSCDCENYSLTAPCVHLATLLIQLRRDSLLQKEPSKKRSSVPSRVKISHLLNKVEKENLNHFILQFARKNRTFANELKAFLSSVMAESIDTSYYMQLIQSAMRLSRKKDNDISTKGAAHVKIIMQELWLQSEDKIASKKYTESTAILKALSTQIPIVIGKVLKPEPFIQLFENTMDAFVNFPQSIISPELSDDIFLFLNNELPLNPIMENRLDRAYLETLLSLANTKDKKTILKNTIDSIKGNGNKWGKKAYVNLILFELMIAQEEKDESKFNKILKDHLSHPDILFHALKDASQEQKWDQVKKFAELGLSQNLNPSFKQVLYQYQYRAAQETENAKDSHIFGEILFLATYENQYLDAILQSMTPKKQYVYLAALLDKIENEKFHTSQKDAIADIYLRMEDFDALFSYIKKIKSLDLLNKVMPILLTDHSKQLKDTYLFLISDYLTFHLGPVPTQKVRMILLNLRKAGAHKIVHNISEHLAKEFPERASLQEELEIL